MTNNLIITIGRQFASGGREIGSKLAAELGIAFYDKELITEAAKASGIDANLFKNAEEQGNNSLIYSLAMGLYATNNRMINLADLSLNDQIYKVQSDMIKKVAQESDCVIVGRCADYILRDCPNCIKVFIHAAINHRMERASNVYHLSEEECYANAILKKDKKRANYYNYHADTKWGDVDAYHITLDSGAVGINSCVKLIKQYALEARKYKGSVKS